ncbi:MAG: AMP-binding protein [Actinomycetota bacterium]|nr:AMP-binding protein [Actinomycetota bacterium]
MPDYPKQNDRHKVTAVHKANIMKFSDGLGKDWTAHLPAGIAADEVNLLADGSLTGRIERQWRTGASWPQLRDVDGAWLSSLELEERTRVAGNRLRAAGLKRGDRVVLIAGTSARWLIAYLGALRAGLVVVPVNPAYTAGEIGRIVGNAKPSAAVVEANEQATCVEQTPGGPVLITGVDLDLPDGGTDELEPVSGEDPALLIYTSGTTGEPKGALLSHANLLASATAIGLAWRWQPDDRLLLSLPLFHVHGLGAGVNGTLCAGASVELRAKFDPDDVARHAATAVTLFFGVPAMYHRLAAKGATKALSRLRLLVSGSAPLPATLAREIERHAGQLPLERYGMTETVMLTSNPYEGERKPGTVGFPLPGVQCRLAEDGEVLVKGQNVIAGYYGRSAADAEAFTADGWFRTGDLGELDDDGYLTLVGRSKELIITGGYNVYPREVEEVLGSHPDVSEVAVVGRASEKWGEEVTAVVVAVRSVAERELIEYAAQELAPYKVPKRIEFAQELPRNALGKLVREKLK